MTEATQPKSTLKKRVNDVAAEEAHELKETSNEDTASVVSLDTRSTFNSTNNENALADTVKATQPIASKMNVEKQPMESHG